MDCSTNVHAVQPRGSARVAELLALAADLYYDIDPGPYEGTMSEPFLILAERAIMERRGR